MDEHPQREARVPSVEHRYDQRDCDEEGEQDVRQHDHACASRETNETGQLPRVFAGNEHISRIQVDLFTAAHGHTDIRCCQRGGVVESVPSHQRATGAAASLHPDRLAFRGNLAAAGIRRDPEPLSQSLDG